MKVGRFRGQFLWVTWNDGKLSGTKSFSFPVIFAIFQHLDMSIPLATPTLKCQMKLPHLWHTLLKSFPLRIICEKLKANKPKHGNLYTNALFPVFYVLHKSLSPILLQFKTLSPILLQFNFLSPILLQFSGVVLQRKMVAQNSCPNIQFYFTDIVMFLYMVSSSIPELPLRNSKKTIFRF